MGREFVRGGVPADQARHRQLDTHPAELYDQEVLALMLDSYTWIKDEVLGAA
jgi:hypothetical protein